MIDGSGEEGVEDVREWVAIHKDIVDRGGFKYSLQVFRGT